MTLWKCGKFVHNPMCGFENMYSRPYAILLLPYTKVVLMTRVGIGQADLAAA